MSTFLDEVDPSLFNDPEPLEDCELFPDTDTLVDEILSILSSTEAGNFRRDVLADFIGADYEANVLTMKEYFVDAPAEKARCHDRVSQWLNGVDLGDAKMEKPLSGKSRPAAFSYPEVAMEKKEDKGELADDEYADSAYESDYSLSD